MILKFEFETPDVKKVADAFCSAYQYQLTIDDQPNPETKAQFTKRMIKEFIVNTVKSEDVKLARQTADATVAEITLT